MGTTEKQKILNKLVKILCKKEKGKKQLNAGDAREVIKVATDLMLFDNNFAVLHCKYCEILMQESHAKVEKEIDKKVEDSTKGPKQV